MVGIYTYNDTRMFSITIIDWNLNEILNEMHSNSLSLVDLFE